MRLSFGTVRPSLGLSFLMIVRFLLCPLFLFTVKEENEVEEGRLVSYPIILSCGPLVPEGNWDFQHEDPMLYLQGNLWDKARREWPELPYPKAEGAPTTPTKDTPKYSREEMDSFLKIHHQFTKLILRLGVDPCKAYKEQNVKNILQHIDANDLDCKVCGKSYTNASRMRLHIQQKHIGVTNYQCTTCYKYYVNEQTLATHISRARLNSSVASARKDTPLKEISGGTFLPMRAPSLCVSLRIWAAPGNMSTSEERGIMRKSAPTILSNLSHSLSVRNVAGNILIKGSGIGTSGKCTRSSLQWLSPLPQLRILAKGSSSVTSVLGGSWTRVT